IRGHKGLDWRDLAETRDGTSALTGSFDRPWRDVLGSSHAVAVGRAHELFANQLTEPLRQELEYAAELEASMDVTRDPEAKETAERLRRFRDVLRNWDVVLDGVGFLSVNLPLQ